jgi:hypothetical protein
VTVSANRVLKRIFIPKREENGSWRKLYDDDAMNACILHLMLSG